MYDFPEEKPVLSQERRKGRPSLRKTFYSTYLFHDPTPCNDCIRMFEVDPITTASSSSPSVNQSDQELYESSTDSLQVLYNPPNVFNFDEDHVYTQVPSIISTALTVPHPGYVQQNHSYVKAMRGELEEKKVLVMDDELHLKLQQIKKEAKLTEVEYGRLLRRIECGEFDDCRELLETCLAE